MVAVKGKGWRLNPLLVRAEQEANAVAPGRKKSSDGSIGDAAHASRESFHNPWEGWVDALDLTHDPLGGFDVHALFRRWVATDDPILDALDHLISNREIASAARGWKWRKYTGPNPHDKHGHMAGKRNNVARSYAGPIFTPMEEDDMSAADVQAINDHTDQVANNLATTIGTAATNVVVNLAARLKGISTEVDEEALAGLVIAAIDPTAIAKAVAEHLPEYELVKK